jgi:hypothetical protein
MSPLSAIRPDEWDVPLFLHVLGALTLIGALALAAAFLFSAWRNGSAESLRLALRTLTLGAIPAYIVLRVGAEWIADKEGYADLDDPPTWIGIGYMAADIGFVLLVIASLVGWRAARRAGDGSGGTGMTRVAAVIIGLVLLMNLVALWAMTTKPI